MNLRWFWLLNPPTEMANSEGVGSRVTIACAREEAKTRCDCRLTFAQSGLLQVSLLLRLFSVFQQRILRGALRARAV